LAARFIACGMTEAGGKDPAALDSALAESYDVVGALLG
jgi:hypothetical protein